MDSDQGKLFIGGISWETSEDKLKDYFGSYGDVLQTVVMRDKVSGKPRGFGFVVFADPDVLDRVLEDRHVIDGRTVEVKKALSREEQQGSKAVNPSGGRNFGSSGGNNRTKKIFVGGLPPSLSEDEFRNYFETYGTVTDVVIMFDQQTNRPRGFGFISFDTEDAVDGVMHKTYHDLCGKQVEVKRALPKDANPGVSGRSAGGSGGGGSGRGGGGSGGYQGYNSSSGGHSGSYNSLMDSSRYMQSQNTGGGLYPPYGGSAYNAAGYGYGATNNGMGGYGGTIPGYGGPAGAGYGNPNLSSAGYGSGPQGALRGSWNAQVASGYGNMGYGNAPWSGNTGTVIGANATGQSPSGAGGYGSQGYGYGGYGSSDGAYGNPAAYGVAVGTPNGNSGGGGGGGGNAAGDVQGGAGGYGDASANWAYGNQRWKSDPTMPSGNYGAPSSGPHGSQGGYAGGYGGAPTRQVLQ